MHGFLNEIVQQIDEESIREKLEHKLEEELHRSTSALLGARADQNEGTAA